jgi:transcription-repair coupling factor (superfamily II helicase)
MISSIEKGIAEKKSILIEELWSAPKAHLLSSLQTFCGKHLLILTDNTKLALDFPYFTNRQVIDFPSWETLPDEKIAPSVDIVGERFKTLSALKNAKEPVILFTTLQAALQKVISPNHFQDRFIKIKKGDVYPFDKFSKKLNELGYKEVPICSDKGEFSIRGSLVDLFCVTSPDPVRIEFWGDDIESIRTFDPIGQKSICQIESVSITAAKDQLFEATLLDYLGQETLVVFDDLLELEDHFAKIASTSQKSPHMLTMETFLGKVDNLQSIYFSKDPIEELSEVERRARGFSPITFEMFGKKLNALRVQNPYAPLSEFLTPDSEPTAQGYIDALIKISDSFQIHLLAENQAEESLFLKLFNLTTPPKNATFEMGYLTSGFANPEKNEIFFPVTEISSKTKIRRQKLRSTYHTPPSEVFEIAPGEAIVHYHNGIGKFLGVEKRENNLGIETEFFHLEYAEGAKLFVPIKDAHLISKYVGTDSRTPKFHTLGSNRWKKQREVTEKAIIGFAKELLELYAKREVTGGFCFQKDSDLTQSFEETFPFIETPDQLAAIDAIKKDMISQKSMDRLVCGDVGYGKTEVAMRAAFKAVADGGKQVAILVPTTVLALQHFESFVERMQYFPIKIGCLSRFHTPKENKKIIQGLSEGSVDIVIGTHRLISKDIHFKNLGLVIIDEEQRFGVKAKEHLKQIKTGVDCLTLSATPIPRTLYMSLVGAKDMSIINTPPQDRLPIKTILTEPTDQTIQSALLRELSRNGQAFVIHNRVETIYSMADRIQKLVPHAKIVVGHGQMDGDELDQIFHAFKSGLADILVATTIVENGIDIPNANTILIDQASHFGLAELYQLRGRVGRWNRAAYCYFLIKNPHTLTEITRRRLTALAESSGYGGGMRLAMRDLEIRGAGDILGVEQSGHVCGIGFYLYCKLLKRTMKTLQGELSPSFLETKVDFAVDARLPEYYVNSSSLRMEFYQRFGEAATLDEADEIQSELWDRFGRAPLQAEWLYRLTRIRIVGQSKGYTLIKGEGVSLILEKHGESRKVLFKIPKTPEDLEKQVLKFLLPLN